MLHNVVIFAQRHVEISIKYIYRIIWKTLSPLITLLIFFRVILRDWLLYSTKKEITFQMATDSNFYIQEISSFDIQAYFSEYRIFAKILCFIFFLFVGKVPIVFSKSFFHQFTWGRAWNRSRQEDLVLTHKFRAKQ